MSMSLWARPLYDSFSKKRWSLSKIGDVPFSSSQRAVLSVVWSKCDHAVLPNQFWLSGHCRRRCNLSDDGLFGIVKTVSTLLFAVVIFDFVGR